MARNTCIFFLFLYLLSLLVSTWQEILVSSFTDINIKKCSSSFSLSYNKKNVKKKKFELMNDHRSDIPTYTPLVPLVWI